MENWSVLRLKSLEDGTIVEAMVQIAVTHEGETENGILNYVHENDADVADYIPFADLTEDQIISWAKAGSNDGADIIAEAKASIEKRVARKAARALSSSVKPWDIAKETE
jgi:hypothetical protein